MATHTEPDGSQSNGPNDGDDYDDAGAPETAPVGSYPANGYGLFNLGGNVQEWVADIHYDEFYDGLTDDDVGEAVVDPYQDQRINTSNVVFRGGSWNLTSNIYQRCAERGRNAGSLAAGWVGFRIVRKVALDEYDSISPDDVTIIPNSAN